jgi:hypothetical protein
MGNKVLILGNSNHINDIRFDKLSEDIVTLGSNRIWYKYMPDILSVTDIQIYEDMCDKTDFDKLFMNTKIITNDWLDDQAGERCSEPQQGEFAFFGTEKLVDGTHIGHLQTPTKLDSKESKGHIPDLPERETWFFVHSKKRSN